MKDLCKAMGIEWHDLVINIPRITCSCGVAWQGEFPMGDFMRHRNPSPTDEAFCWKALQYMMGREDWNCFVFAARVSFGTYKPENDFIKHFLTDPARFVKLCAEWCREHKEVKA